MERVMSHLEGKVAVITGGSSGIGFATAKRFVKEGAYVFITGRRQSELDRAKVEIGKNVTTVQGDVASLADLDRLYATVKAEKGTVDIVVANAGFIEHAKIFDLSEAHYDKTMDINLKGVVFTVQKALPLMKLGGSIVVVSSIINVKGVPAHGTYAAAKAGVRALVRVWAQELKDRGIRVNTLSPGATETPIIRGQFDSDEASDAAKTMFASMTPLGRIGLPEEIAAGAYFLASDESSYVTGIDLPIDGGLAQV
jgi:NAD(P)-dependent dehydrogenase (short-subunit alcohol dehydrogenase family)